MAIDIKITFTDAEIDQLLADGWDTLRLFRDSFVYGKAGRNFNYSSPINEWTIVDGTTEYEYTDSTGHADNVYVWAPYDQGTLTLGDVRPAFEPKAVRLVSLLIELARAIDPVHLLYSSLTGLPTATSLPDNKIVEANDFYNGKWLLLTSGAVKGEYRQITDWMSGTSYTVSPGFSAAPAAGDEYVVVPFHVQSAINAVDKAIGLMYPSRFWRREDTSLKVTSGEQVYDIPPPIKEVEEVAYLPQGATVRHLVPFEPTGDGRFRLHLWSPGVGETLYVTGRAPFSVPYDLDQTTELSHPAETQELLLRAELLLRSSPDSGVDTDDARLRTLAALIGDTARPQFKRVPVVRAIG